MKTTHGIPTEIEYLYLKRFRLKLENGEIIAVSEGYKGKPACLKAIEKLRGSV